MPVSENFPSGLPNPSGDNYSFEEQPRVRVARFGDGYEQRTADGLNANPRKFSVEWPNLSTTDKDTLRDFLVARGGWEAFNWTPPLEVSTVKVKAPSWTVQRASGPYWSVRAEFVQVFDQ